MKTVPALTVTQWLREWEKVKFSAKDHRRKPEPNFYIFKMVAPWLKSLSGIQRRTTESGQLRSADLGIQRRHDEQRSAEIRQFIHYGYPWSELSPKKRGSGEFDDLRKPGWLPTSIVVNILEAQDVRRGLRVAPKDLVKVSTAEASTATITLPERFADASWRPESLPPIEVIDGQHRLWAFEGDGFEKEFELPVVAFHGLDISWQAYLFWTINIKPKKINASLAFDLYPLLRTEDWLDKFEGHSIYRETRAQELTEGLWAIRESPWYQRINMLGESGLETPMVSQAAWVRSLMATFVKRWEGPKIGGLFGARLREHDEVLPWSRAQQAALLIYLGQCVKEAIKSTKADWAKELRKGFPAGDDPAFYGANSLLMTDQGIRGLLHIVNDLCYVRADELKLVEWKSDVEAGASDEQAVRRSLSSLSDQRFSKFVDNIAVTLATYDWRTSSAPGLEESERIRKAAFRGSGGYKELRRDLLKHVVDDGKVIGKAAEEVFIALGYNK
ncbi:MAG TPA: DGQHR domain-containing protein [Verrucomicrobiae bacterium]|nr:DGQHR domain-containing protein [Verrucomicrobiae bacterium]